MYMTILYVFLGFVLGFLIWYFLFYFRYEDTKVVDQLRENFKSNKQELEETKKELEEYKKQNEILKEETQRLKDENTDFSKVVAELSRYLYYIRKAGNKAQELAHILSAYDPNIESKVKELLNNWWDHSEYSDSEEEDESESYIDEDSENQEQDSKEWKKFF